MPGYDYQSTIRARDGRTVYNVGRRMEVGGPGPACWPGSKVIECRPLDDRQTKIAIAEQPDHRASLQGARLTAGFACALMFVEREDGAETLTLWEGGK